MKNKNKMNKSRLVGLVMATILIGTIFVSLTVSAKIGRGERIVREFIDDEGNTRTLTIDFFGRYYWYKNGILIYKEVREKDLNLPLPPLPEPTD